MTFSGFGGSFSISVFGPSEASFFAFHEAFGVEGVGLTFFALGFGR